MPNIKLKRYNSFNRLILSEVMTEQELGKLDELYNRAKVLKVAEKYFSAETVKMLKESILKGKKI